VQDLGSGVLDAVLVAEGDVGRLILDEFEDFVVTRDAGAAGDHDPVLGPVVMQAAATSMRRV
jgi:hypothetical protein